MCIYLFILFGKDMFDVESKFRVLYSTKGNALCKVCHQNTSCYCVRYSEMHRVNKIQIALNKAADEIF